MRVKLSSKNPFKRFGAEIGFSAGVGLLSYGCWLAWHPLGFIVAGATLATNSFLAGYRRPS